MVAQLITIEALTLGKTRQRAFIIDGLVERNAQRGLYQRFKGIPFKLNLADHRNSDYALHFAHHFAREDWIADLVIARYVKIAETILRQRRQAWRGVDRVYVNATLFGDYNFCHRDGCDWTALAFVNDEWRDHWGGELMLYRDGDLDAPAIAIRPKPGRMVIFDGHMVHRPGVPTKYCVEPRLTLACKIGEGKPTRKRAR